MARTGRFDAAAAARWRAAGVPSWLYRIVLPALWVVAIAVSTFGDTERCSVVDPAVCGPDVLFAVVLIACFAILLAQWWMPRLGWACGVLFGLADLRYDDVGPARMVWGLLGLFCTALLIWSAVARTVQRRIDQELVKVPVRTGGETPWIGRTWRVVAAGLLVVLGLGSLWLMQFLDQREDRHLSRAVVRDAVVRSIGDDGDAELELPDGSRRKVTPYDDYNPGDTIPVRIDPDDPEWVRLVAEPADNTLWITVSGGLWALALALGYEDLRRRVTARRGPDLTGTPVRVAFDVRGRLAVFGVDEPFETPAAYLAVDYVTSGIDRVLDELVDIAELDDEDEPPDEDDDEVDRALGEYLGRYRGEAVLCGELVEGAWPVVVTPGGTLRAAGPLRAPRTGIGRRGDPVGERFVVASPPRHTLGGPAGDRVAVPETTIPSLPWVARTGSVPAWDDWLLFVAAIIAPAGLWWIGPQTGVGPIGAVMLGLGLGIGLFPGLSAFCRQIVVDRDGLHTTDLLWSRYVAWRDVSELVRRGRSITVSLRAGGRFRIGFDDPKAPAYRVSPVLEAVRRTAAGGRASTKRLNWSAYVIAVYLAALAAAVVRVIRAG